MKRKRAFVSAAVLLLGLCCLPTTAVAQARPYSLEDIAQALAAGLGGRFLDLARNNCVSFVMDSVTTRRLQAVGADARYVAALGGVCYRGSGLEVATEPAGAQLRVQGARVGVTPWTSPYRAGANTLLEASNGGAVRSVRVDIPADRVVRVSMQMPRDTAPVPEGLSPTQVSALRATVAQFDASAPRPAPPQPPRAGGAWGATILGLAAGAAGGALAGVFACSTKETVYVRDFPDTSVFVASGTRRRLNGGCMGAAAAGGGLVGLLLGRFAGQRAGVQRQREYAAAARDYDAMLVRLAQRGRDAEVAREQLRRVEERERVVAQNARIRAQNLALPAPVVDTVAARRWPRPVVETP